MYYMKEIDEIVLCIGNDSLGPIYIISPPKNKYLFLERRWNNWGSTGILEINDGI